MKCSVLFFHVVSMYLCYSFAFVVCMITVMFIIWSGRPFPLSTWSPEPIWALMAMQSFLLLVSTMMLMTGRVTDGRVLNNIQWAAWNALQSSLFTLTKALAILLVIWIHAHYRHMIWWYISIYIYICIASKLYNWSWWIIRNSDH